METTAGLRLPTVLAAFADGCPRVDFSLITGPTEQLVRNVLDYRLDGAPVNGPVRQPWLWGSAELHALSEELAKHLLRSGIKGDVQAGVVARTVFPLRPVA